jgi:hypothetical protein
MIAVLGPDLKAPSPAARQEADRALTSLRDLLPLLIEIEFPPEG